MKYLARQRAGSDSVSLGVIPKQQFCCKLSITGRNNHFMNSSSRTKGNSPKSSVHRESWGRDMASALYAAQTSLFLTVMMQLHILP
jgi:hypothetical protein